LDGLNAINPLDKMKKTLIHIASFTLLVGAVALTPVHSQAQASTNAPTAPRSSDKGGEVARFHGSVTAIDQTAKTITVGRATYVVTSKSKVFKNNKPATLEDGAVGDFASGAYKLVDEKRLVLRIEFKPKAGAEGSAPPETK
jgi:hypothetical protein